MHTRRAAAHFDAPGASPPPVRSPARCSAHHFCFECYQSWVARKASCPTCRAPVWTITRDAEFAGLIGAKCNQSTSAVPAAGAEGDADAVEVCQRGPTRPFADPGAHRLIHVGSATPHALLSALMLVAFGALAGRSATRRRRA